MGVPGSAAGCFCSRYEDRPFQKINNCRESFYEYTPPEVFKEFHDVQHLEIFQFFSSPVRLTGNV
jgi:hypothetical protein